MVVTVAVITHPKKRPLDIRPLAKVVFLFHRFSVE
jgi:hypothetical protein